jgi:hypothetical protein
VILRADKSTALHATVDDSNLLTTVSMPPVFIMSSMSVVLPKLVAFPREK